MKDFRKMLGSKDMNAQTASLFETMARDNIKDFLEFFRKDYFAKIDFDKGCELLDEAMPHFLPPNHTVRKDAFNLFVKAPLKKGGLAHFLIHTLFDMAKGQIQVGIADVPDDVMAAYQRSKDDLNSGMGKKQEYTDANQCSNCGRTDLPLTITLNANTMKRLTLCSVCLYNSGPSGETKRKVNLKQLDKDIAEYEELAKNYEELIQKTPKMPKLPSGLEQFAMTPLSSYKSIQAVLGELRSQRVAAMTTMESETRLQYELKKALEAEDYTKSAAIRDKLNTKKNKKEK